MKKSVFLFLLFAAYYSQAQKSHVNEVLTLEKAFAAYSVEHNTKAAFLQFLDSTGVVFENGKPVNGRQSWSQKEVKPGVLNWHPVYGEISSSGDLGFTTGPWTFQPKTVNDSVLARGQYSTVWKKTTSGEWKFIVDIGVSKTPAFIDAAYLVPEKETKFVAGTWNNLLNKEQKFMRLTTDADSSERLKWYSAHVSNNAFFLNRNEQLPVTKADDLRRAIHSMPRKIEYTIDGSGISHAGDLGYVFGTMQADGKTENYLRIWKREGIEWRLALEVLRF